MRAQTSAHVRAGGVLGRLHCEPPLTLRRVGGDPGVCALCLVGSAAGPLAGDEFALELTVDAGARATLVATGATIAQGRGGAAAALDMTARLDPGAGLSADPGPLVVAEGSHVDVTVTLDLAADATLDWRELVVLGRSNDASAGTATIRWDVVRAGRPVLRQAVDLTSSRHRVIASALVTGPALAARTVVHSPTAVAQRIDGTTMLATVLGDDAAEVRRELGDLVTGRGAAFGGAVLVGEPPARNASSGNRRNAAR